MDTFVICWYIRSPYVIFVRICIHLEIQQVTCLQHADMTGQQTVGEAGSSSVALGEQYHDLT